MLVFDEMINPQKGKPDHGSIREGGMYLAMLAMKDMKWKKALAGDDAASIIQPTGVDTILALGECPPKDLKIGEEWGPEVLNLQLRLFLFYFKRPRHQMACKHPKFGLILDAINTSFVSSLLFCAKRNRGTSCLGSEKDQEYHLWLSRIKTGF